MAPHKVNEWFEIRTEKLNDKDHHVAYASQHIPPGTLILSEKLFFETLGPPRGTPYTQYQDFNKRLDKLGRDQLKNMNHAVSATHDEDWHQLFDILHRNAIAVDDHLLLFLYQSTFSHSCSPHAECTWNPSKERCEILVHRQVEAGNKICVSHLLNQDLLEAREERRQKIEKKLKIHCECEACHISSSSDSDDRRDKIRQYLSKPESMVSFTNQYSRGKHHLDLAD